MDNIFTPKDIRQIESKGLTVEKVLAQIEFFRKGFPCVRLERPCTAGDGITVLPECECDRLAERYDEAVSTKNVLKFVPASGAASRLLKPLLALNQRHGRLNERQIAAGVQAGDADAVFVQVFLDNIERFAFYDELKAVMAKAGFSLERLLQQGEYKELLEYALTLKGLNYADSPKGLITFHSYSGDTRTAFEEHLMEAAAYSNCRAHFTVSPSHRNTIEDFMTQVVHKYTGQCLAFHIEYSTQKPSTDTIALDPQNELFRNQDGSLLFRPGGHGALLENLSELNGDIVFIKNIDNVVPDHLKSETYRYKRILGAYLLELQQTMFQYLETLESGEGDEQFLKQAFKFARQRLSLVLPENIETGSKEEQCIFLFSILNRPLRVCGMVKNQGEPGGGPFWVTHSDGAVSRQIIEKSQINMQDAQQRAILEASTHFNPVDLVCGIRNYVGQAFNLREFVDPETGFISSKAQHGKALKALELPGLWNGAMAYWNTVFVEVPLSTFNPVKTINDLLRTEHQPQKENTDANDDTVFHA